VTGSAPQWLDLEGVVNMRDVGGLPTTDGGRIASGRLIRSDNLQELPPASVRRLLDELHVTDVVDLRTSVEVAKEGDGPLVGEGSVQIHQLSLYTEDTRESGIPAGERELPWVRDPELGDRPAAAAPAVEDRNHDAFWSRHYLGYLSQRPDSVLEALRTIARSEGATVVHCAAGKDRTGTIVGLALLVAGATPDAVAADFAASSERVPQIMERLSRRPAYAANLVGKSVDEQSPRPDTMRRLVEALDREGGVEAWLTRHGWTPDETAVLRTKLRDA
jgi:protein tyrosine/serine phosphatase